jgi:hypothetical protein
MSLPDAFDLPPLPEPTLEEYARFTAYVGGFSTGNRSGDLVLTYKVPPDRKYDAFPVTDLQDEMVEVVIMRRVFPDLGHVDLGGDDE